ncbi:uncharacterized protein [Anabrus simplex]|uniref:uncharacterized protein n=1 Tax=Anabrus simplex TaxID=316456 RepID=UPI0035A296EB
MVSIAVCALLLLLGCHYMAAIKIDSQLSAVTSDCYDRVAIGQRIPQSDVTRTVALQMVKACEKECNMELDKCGAFSFGISSEGNGTCLLARVLPPRGTLMEDPDYDSYVKKDECRILPPPSYPLDVSRPTSTAPSRPQNIPQQPDLTACFRRLFAGKRVSERHVRSSLPTLTVEACQRECAAEKHFTCEGFNYRFDVGGLGRGSCELVSIPSERLDPAQDFFPDRDYDYYERDRNGPPGCSSQQGGLYGGTDPYGPWGTSGKDYGQGSGGWSYAQSGQGGYGYGGGAVGHYGQGGFDGNGPHGQGGYGGSAVGTYGQGSYGGSGLHGQGSYGGSAVGPYGQGGHGGSAVGPYGQGGSHQHGGYGGHGHGYEGGIRRGDHFGPGWNRPPAVYRGPWRPERPPPRPYDWKDERRPSLPPPPPWNKEPSIAPPGPPPPGPPRPGPPPPGLPPAGPSTEVGPFGQQECFLRARAGFRLDRGSVKVAHAVPSLYDCELECARERRFLCLTFSFRYSLEPTYPRDNCLLSNRHIRELDSYTDLLQDRDYDVYVRNEDSRACAVETPPVFRPDPGASECFRRVRSGQRLDRSVVRDSINAQTVVECELECLRSRYFTCRIFSFRYGSPTIGGPLDSCLLSDWPLYELQPIRHLQDDLSFELYERGSFGHGCELDRPPVHISREPPPPPPPLSPPTRPKPEDDLCYEGYGAPARLLPGAVKTGLSVPSELDCKAECSRARESFRFYCAALSFRVHTSSRDDSPNCLLSDVEQRDLRPGLDYVHEADHWLFAFISHDPRCAPEEHHPHHHFPERDYSATWSHFTVSGRPCRHNSACTQNREAGFWSCELEGGDAGAFDYCCRPGHQCGYSEGYSYPWCYVGEASQDQWRPCSDHYYPYPGHDEAHGPGPGPRPTHGAYDIPHGEHSPYSGYDEEYPGPPPGHDVYHYNDYGPPRYWPVAYLHHEAPPNSTYLDKPRPHLDVGFDNYVDTYRSGFGKKKMLRLDDNNNSSRKTAERNFILGVSLTSKNNNDRTFKPVSTEMTDNMKKKDEMPSFEVVDEKDDDNDKDKDQDNDKTSGSGSLALAKLQPRLARPRGEAKVVRSITQDNKAWRWTLEEEDLTPVKTVILPVDFHRKPSQPEAFSRRKETS